MPEELCWKSSEFISTFFLQKQCYINSYRMDHYCESEGVFVCWFPTQMEVHLNVNCLVEEIDFSWENVGWYREEFFEEIDITAIWWRHHLDTLLGISPPTRSCVHSYRSQGRTYCRMFEASQLPPWDQHKLGNSDIHRPSDIHWSWSFGLVHQRIEPQIEPLKRKEMIVKISFWVIFYVFKQ